MNIKILLLLLITLITVETKDSYESLAEMDVKRRMLRKGTSSYRAPTRSSSNNYYKPSYNT